MEPALSRRSFLTYGGALSAATLTPGCSALGSGETGIVLGGITVRNSFDEPHTVRVELQRDDELLLEETVDVAGSGGVETIERSWSSDPGEFTIRYTVRGPGVDLDILTGQATADDRPDDGSCGIAVIELAPSAPSPGFSVLHPTLAEGNCP